jgi:hypothetical protein
MSQEPNWKELALRMSDADECDFDHNGWCQTHYTGYTLDSDDPCPHGVIQSWQKENDDA